MAHFVKLARAIFGPTAGERVEAEREKAAQRQRQWIDEMKELSRLRRVIEHDANQLRDLCAGSYAIRDPDVVWSRYLVRQLSTNLKHYRKLKRRTNYV